MTLVRTVFVGLAVLSIGPCDAFAQVADQTGGSASSDPVLSSEFSSQQKKKKAAAKRAPTRIIVRRTYPYYQDASIYPRPDEFSYPGPNGVRECVARLVPEARASGPVIVPRTFCRWVIR